MAASAMRGGLRATLSPICEDPAHDVNSGARNGRRWRTRSKQNGGTGSPRPSSLAPAAHLPGASIETPRYGRTNVSARHAPGVAMNEVLALCRSLAELQVAKGDKIIEEGV